MEFSANQIAELLQGTIEGDSEWGVHTLAKIEEGHKEEEHEHEEHYTHSHHHHHGEKDAQKVNFFIFM